MSTENPNSDSPKDKSELVKLARQLLDELPAPTNISANTRQSYEREFNRTWSKSRSIKPEAEHLFSTISETSSKRTYYRRLASVKYGLRNLVEKALDRDKPHLLGYLVSLHALLKQHAGTCPIASPKPRHSKRQDIIGLPADWRERMYKEIDRMGRGKYELSFLVMALTGCRPEELKRGISITTNPDVITFKINGVKVKKTQGQEWREIDYSMNNKHPLLQEFFSIYSGEGVVCIDNKSNYTGALQRAGRRLWPKKVRTISSYCLRHAAASDFKQVLSLDDVSKAIGHMVDATRSLYGQRQMSRSGGLRPAAVRASRPIKSTAPKFSKKPQRLV